MNELFIYINAITGLIAGLINLVSYIKFKDSKKRAIRLIKALVCWYYCLPYWALIFGYIDVSSIGLILRPLVALIFVLLTTDTIAEWINLRARD